MNIGQIINGAPEDLAAQRFNLVFGISLGNRYFTVERIATSLPWALKNSRESLLILIPDWIHAINLRVLDKKSEAAAIKKAFSMGDKKILELQEIIKTLSIDDQSRVHIARWSDIVSDDTHTSRVSHFFTDFAARGTFYTHVMEIIHENFKKSPHTLDTARLEKLAEYILHELPLFLDGINFGGARYDAMLYPGLGAIDYLVRDLQQGEKFPELSRLLAIGKSASVIEAWIE